MVLGHKPRSEKGTFMGDLKSGHEGQVGINSFVKRQTRHSRFSHFEGKLEVVAAMAQEHLSEGVPTNREGILVVPVPADGFFSGVVKVTSTTNLRATFEARCEGEQPFVQVVATGADKLPAAVVELVLYHHTALTPDERTTEDEWELVSINARPTAECEPLTPMAMARNFLGLPGGTKAEYTAEEFAKAIEYWSKRVMAG